MRLDTFVFILLHEDGDAIVVELDKLISFLNGQMYHVSQRLIC